MSPLIISAIAGAFVATIVAFYVQVKCKDWITTLQATMLAFAVTFILFCICFACALSLERM